MWHSLTLGAANIAAARNLPWCSRLREESIVSARIVVMRAEASLVHFCQRVA